MDKFGTQSGLSGIVADVTTTSSKVGAVGAPRRAGDLAYATLRDALRRGLYSPGRRLPGERDLAAQLGVSRTTLRQTLARFAEEGTIEASPNRGWFVARDLLTEPPSVLQTFTELARSRGLRPGAKVLRHVVEPATIAEAEQLRMAPSAPVLHIDRLRFMDDFPICLDYTVAPFALFERLATSDLTDRSLYAAAEECGVTIVRSNYSVQAVPADEITADLLDIALGSPVLLGSGVTYDDQGVPVLTSTTRYRGDAYRFTADLFRPIA
jgi:GntR family transcriptional regulator